MISCPQQILSYSANRSKFNKNIFDFLKKFRHFSYPSYATGDDTNMVQQVLQGTPRSQHAQFLPRLLTSLTKLS
jgi:hypothetical protein